MTITEQIIDTETADGPMAIVHASPEGGSPKRVLIFMDAPGIRPRSRTSPPGWPRPATRRRSPTCGIATAA